MNIPIAAAVCAAFLLQACLPASAAPCTTQTLAAPNTPVLSFTLLHRTGRIATFGISFDTRTTSPVALPTSGLAIKLLLDGRTFRQVMFPFSTRASFVAGYPPVGRGAHEFAAELIAGSSVVQTRTRCLVFR